MDQLKKLIIMISSQARTKLTRTGQDLPQKNRKRSERDGKSGKLTAIKTINKNL